MRFDREKSFGYPTLRTFLPGDDIDLMDYPRKNFDPDIAIIHDKDSEFIDFEFEVGLRVSALRDLINQKKAVFHFKIECPATLYSESIVTYEEEGKFQIAAHLLRGKYEITPFVVATSNFELSSKEFHDDFLGMTFAIKKGSVLAIGRSTESAVNREQFRSVSSIFEFSANEAVTPGDFLIRSDEDYVVIEVNPSIFERVLRAEADIASRTLILNSLYVPVVMHLIYELIHDRALENQKKWASVFVEKGHSKGVDIFDEGAVAKNAQILLHMPFAKLAESGFRV